MLNWATLPRACLCFLPPQAALSHNPKPRATLLSPRSCQAPRYHHTWITSLPPPDYQPSNLSTLNFHCQRHRPGHHDLPMSLLASVLTGPVSTPQPAWSLWNSPYNMCLLFKCSAGFPLPWKQNVPPSRTHMIQPNLTSTPWIIPSILPKYALPSSLWAPAHAVPGPGMLFPSMN